MMDREERLRRDNIVLDRTETAEESRGWKQGDHMRDVGVP